MFKSDLDRISPVLPHVLACKHAHEVWAKVHKHFNSQIKAQFHQLRYKLKTSKKGTRSISKYILRIRTIANSLLAIGDPISEWDQVNAILQGLPEEYNSFIMMVYRKCDLTDMYEVEALLYIQEAQLDKYKQELATSSAFLQM
ncbi:unnamed protein product [Vicia faba]|uniref:Retrovirus-related Pol polyprotein from transposon TNT 1-94 n=1 Tax=Vicia faba TaxID=3906 RepID=A0AAV1AR92_VICFA|nr:unnamed protein product [Vicia faba]